MSDKRVVRAGICEDNQQYRCSSNQYADQKGEQGEGDV